MSIESINPIWIIISVFLATTLFQGIRIVPQQQAWVIERLGKYHSTLGAGLNFIIPFVDKVAYKHSLKEEAIDVASQSAITKDNVSLTLDGILYVVVIDPKQASYGVENPYFALTQLAQTTMRSEIGRISLDKTFEERDSLNTKIVTAINEAAQHWGVQCKRYEIKDIVPPQSVLISMEQQVTAERQKRAEILESEGKRQAQINIAEAEKQQVVLESEAAKIDQINRAEGEATAIKAVAEATADGIEKVAIAIEKQGGSDAVALRVAEQYVGAFGNIAKEGNTILLPSDAGNAGSMVAQALSIFQNMKKTDQKS
jgi:regulator of protease activity HflC (stomatin/prohibitin superfamily)